MNLHLNYPSRKLTPKQQGPFKISQVLSPLTYHLCLSATWKIHNVFHASLLSSYKETKAHGPNFSKPPPDLIGTEEEYEVEWIVSHQGTSGHRRYLTTWKGYPSSENTWESESNLRHASEILGTYCYASRQTYVEVNDTYSEGGTHEETLHPQSKARVMNKRRGDKVTIRRIVDS